MKQLYVIVMCLMFPFVAMAQKAEDEQDARYRAFIDDFLQTYQAAYEKKQIEYISNFFSSDALIITETKELSKCGVELVPMSTKKRPYKLMVEDKEEYINRLKDIFAKNVKIKLGVSGKRVVRHTLHPKIYGVSFLQMWLDQHEGNNLESQMPGYIFLMVDFKKSDVSPTIHVRTWQPKDNIKAPKDKFNLMDFRIYDYSK